jgi:hypothetical protein
MNTKVDPRIQTALVAETSGPCGCRCCRERHRAEVHGIARTPVKRADCQCWHLSLMNRVLRSVLRISGASNMTANS